MCNLKFDYYYRCLCAMWLSFINPIQKNHRALSWNSGVCVTIIAISGFIWDVEVAFQKWLLVHKGYIFDQVFWFIAIHPTYRHIFIIVFLVCFLSNLASGRLLVDTGIKNYEHFTYVLYLSLFILFTHVILFCWGRDSASNDMLSFHL